MLHSVAFHPGNHCLPIYMLRGFLYTKGFINLGRQECSKKLVHHITSGSDLKPCIKVDEQLVAYII